MMPEDGEAWEEDELAGGGPEHPRAAAPGGAVAGDGEWEGPAC